ncbi:MAG: type II secretion system protein N [Acidiferrobacterales bacterium]
MVTLHPLAGPTNPLATLWERLQRMPGQRWLPGILSAAALLLLTASMAQWTWQLIQPPQSRVISQMAGSRGPNAETIDLPALLAANLFGEATFEAAPAPPPVEEIPESSLDMILTGVVAAGAEGFALIRVNNDPETPFAIGDEITHGVILRDVYPDRAIIQRRGITEALLMEDLTASLAEPPSMPDARVPTRGEIRAEGDNVFSVDRNALNEELRNPDLLRQALMVPNAGGGFLVRQIKPGSLYQKLGLRVGDVVRKVNGRDINTLDEALQLYQQLGGAEQVTGVEIEVMRAGRMERLQYTIQ